MLTKTAGMSSETFTGGEGGECGTGEAKRVTVIRMTCTKAQRRREAPTGRLILASRRITFFGVCDSNFIHGTKQS